MSVLGHQPKSLEQCHSIMDLRAVAQRRLPSPVFHYLDGGAETEVTARRNVEAFDAQALLPRCLVNVGTVSTGTRVLGQEIQWPVICSPTGASRLFHPEGELAVARAAARAGLLYGLAVSSTYALEAVATVCTGPKMFQLMIFKDRDLTRELIERCKRADYQALCMTVDTVVTGKRERDLQTGFGVPPKFTMRSLASFAMHPGWGWKLLRHGPLELPNLAERSGVADFTGHSRFFGSQLDPTATWEEMGRLIELWRGPVALKGIMTADDARRAADIGATAVIVSNHGGRQLDGVAAPIEVLPEIAQAVGDRVDVILDGGIRRGVHVLKALALGAKACSIGRPYLYGLSAGGEAGVVKALDILKQELIQAMKLSGCADARHIDGSLIGRFD